MPQAALDAALARQRDSPHEVELTPRASRRLPRRSARQTCSTLRLGADLRMATAETTGDRETSDFAAKDAARAGD